MKTSIIVPALICSFLIVTPVIADHPAEGSTLAFYRVAELPGNRYTGDIHAMNIDGTGLRRLTTSPIGQEADSMEPDFSPDGRRIVFSSNRHDLVEHTMDLYVMDAWDIDGDGHGDNCARITFDDAPDKESFAPVWSPAGDKIAFVSNRGPTGRYEIYLADPDGSNQRRLTESPADDWNPDWSPDGMFIVFSRSVGSNLLLYRIEVATGNVTPLTAGETRDDYPTWGDNGLIAFQRYTESNGTHIYVLDPEDPNVPNATPMQISDAPYADASPTWSPGSSHVMFERLTSPKVTPTWLVQTHADGTGPVNVTEGTVRDLDVAWGPVAAAGAPGGLNDCAYQVTATALK